MVNSESENKYAKGARMASWKGQNLNLADIQPATQGLSVDHSNGTEVGSHIMAAASPICF